MAVSGSFDFHHPNLVAPIELNFKEALICFLDLYFDLFFLFFSHTSE